MKGILNTFNREIDRSRVLALDPSTHSVAFAMVMDGKPVHWGKIQLHKKSDLTEKLVMTYQIVDELIQKYDPTYVVIEQTIMVQNPLTTRVLSYVVGSMILNFALRGIDVTDVPPMTVKNYHGYKRVTKKMEQELGKKEAAHLRKSQIQDKVVAMFPYCATSDDDVSDACSIALWGAGVSMKNV